jgi:hypothetical protein
MITDNYKVSEEIINYVNSKGIPKLDINTLLKLAPKFSDYKDNYFVFKQNPKGVLDFPEIVLDVDTNIRTYGESGKNGLSQDDLESEIKSLYEKALAECVKELEYLHKEYNFTTTKDFSEIKIYNASPEEDLTFSDDYEEEALKAYEEYLATKLGLEEKLIAQTQEDSALSVGLLDLSGFYTFWDPATKSELYQWKASPEDILSAILEPAADLCDKITPFQLAMDVLDNED